MSDQIKTLIVDDSFTFRRIIASSLKEISSAEVVGEAKDGLEAIEKVKKLNPDLILLDIEMPNLDGIETLKRIREFNDDAEVIIISSQNIENAKKTLETLNSGALDFIPKYSTGDFETNKKNLLTTLKTFINAVRAKKNLQKLSSIESTISKSSTPTIKKEEKSVTASIKSSPHKNLKFVLIGISTGGPNALQQLIPTISKEISVPILIVQHMPPMFTEQLAARLNKLSDLNVMEAKEGDQPKPGEVYIAPGGFHMVLSEKNNELSLSLTQTEPVNSCRPSVDVLFKSVPQNLHKNVLTVIMTGMGRDGADGVAFLRKNGAYSLIQNEETCTIFGMPAAVKDSNEYDEELPLSSIGERISKIVLGNRF